MRGRGRPEAEGQPSSDRSRAAQSRRDRAPRALRAERQSSAHVQASAPESRRPAGGNGCAPSEAGGTRDRPMRGHGVRLNEIRGAVPADEDQLLEVAGHLNTVNLPNDREEIRGILEHAQKSFTGAIKDPRRREYVFVAGRPRASSASSARR